jgi:hypothetical protein
MARKPTFLFGNMDCSQEMMFPYQPDAGND